MAQAEQSENIPLDGEGASAPAAKIEAKREVSSIAFPYGDLEDAAGFAKAVHEVGGQSCLIEQLAGHLRIAATGGSFRVRLSTARIFSLIQHERGYVELTKLGMRSVDLSQLDSAKVDAFLTVPLYKAIYEKYKGYTLPPTAALEREIANLGVSSKQTDKARQAFERSAKYAGFYWAGPDRLTLPVASRQAPETRPVEPAPVVGTPPHYRGNGGGGGDDGLHPFIKGLLDAIPPPKSPKSEWSIAERADWLQTAASVFKLMYTGDGTIEINAVEPRNDNGS